MTSLTIAPAADRALDSRADGHGDALAVVLVGMRCPDPTTAESHRARWMSGGCTKATVSGGFLTGSFPSVFDALIAIGAVGAGGRDQPAAAAAQESLAMVCGTRGAGENGDSLQRRLSDLLSAALPGQCLVCAEVGLLAGPLLGSSLDLVDSGRREIRQGLGTDRSGSIVYDIRPTALSERLDSCPRLEWARRRLHGALEGIERGLAIGTPRSRARVTSLVADDVDSLELAVARLALGAHAQGAHVLRTETRTGARPMMSAVVELLAAYADDCGLSLTRTDPTQEWALVSRVPAAASVADRRALSTSRRRSRDSVPEMLDLLDRLLRRIADNGATVLVISEREGLDPLSRVLLERVLGDRRLSDLQLVIGSVGEEPELVRRLRRRLGDRDVELVHVSETVSA